MSDPASSNNATADGGTSPEGSTNACADAGTDPGLANAAPPVGSQLQVGDNLSVRGVTSDGFVIYSDDAALRLHAVPIGGGAQADLGALGSKFWVIVDGSVVFIWSNVTAANVGALATWSSPTGLHAFSTASLGIVASASVTNNQILYVDHVSSDGNTGDVVEAAIDGSGAKTLVSGANVNGCIPQLGFVGSFAIASHCDVPFTSTPIATISSFTGDTSARADLMTNAENYWAGAGTAEVLVSTDAAGIQVVPAGGGSAVAVDSTGFLGTLTSDGKTALYGTKSHALRRSPVTAPAPVTLVDNGFGGFWGISPDQQWVLYFNNLGTNGGDVFMASAVTPSTPTTLSSDINSQLRGDAFTADSSHAIFSTTVDPCTSVGSLQALAVGTNSPQSLGTRSWTDWAVGESKVVFNDNFAPDNGLRFGRADVESVDLAQGATPKRVVDRADAVIGVSAAGNQLVYVWSARPGSLAGLYVTPLP